MGSREDVCCKYFSILVSDGTAVVQVVSVREAWENPNDGLRPIGGGVPPRGPKSVNFFEDFFCMLRGRGVY